MPLADLPPRTSASRRHTASFSVQNKRIHTQEVTSESMWKHTNGQCGCSYLLAAFLEHVLLFLRHHLPLFAAQHHALGAGDVLHVDHQLGAVQRVAIAKQMQAAVKHLLSLNKWQRWQQWAGLTGVAWSAVRQTCLSVVVRLW